MGEVVIRLLLENAQCALHPAELCKGFGECRKAAHPRAASRHIQKRLRLHALNVIHLSAEVG